MVRGTGIRAEDIGIKGEAIAKVDRHVDSGSAARVIDATGKLIFPGIIDAHTHPVYLDDCGGLSRTAAWGGTTTVIHYAYAKPGMKLVDTVQRFKDDCDRDSVLDYSIHGALFDAANQAEEIPAVMEMGVKSFKMFMPYAKLKWMTDDYWLSAAMDLIAQGGGLAAVHAESGLAIDYLEDKYLKSDMDQKDVFLTTHPDVLETEAVFRAICIAEVMGCPVYIAHVSAARSIEVIQAAQARGQRVYGETCPQYLALTDEEVRRKGPLAKIGPPLRTREDNKALWNALQNGVIRVIASDHAPKDKKETDDFFEAPFGSPSAETLLTITYDEGVNGGRIDPCCLVRALSEGPARIFGLYPKKGAIEEGSDADVVIFDPSKTHTITHATQHSGAPYTVYEGRACLGAPVMSLQRGRVVLEDGELRIPPGQATFLPTLQNK